MSSRFWYLLGRKLAGEATLDEIRELEVFLLQNPDVASQAEIHSKFFNTKCDPSSKPADIEVAWQKQLDKLEASFPEDFGPEEKNVS